MTKKKKNTMKQEKKSERQEFEESLKGMTKEEIIAANKARVAKYHPEPDLSTCPKLIYQARKKIEFEKKMKERAKKIWLSIVSVPMGGLKKR